MVNYEIIEESPVSDSEVLEIVGQKDAEDLTYREEKILEFIKKSNTLKMEDFKKVYDDMVALEIPRLESDNIIKIIDLKPEDGTGLRAIVSNSGTVIVDESVTKILDVLKKYQ